MQADPKLIHQLNQVLTSELTSINQFFLHARMYKNWGLEGLNKACYRKSIMDMKQADELIERILFLKGLPNLQALGKLMIGEHPEEMLKCDKDFESQQLPLIRRSITLCEQEQDYVSRAILTKILDQEEEYLDWIEAQEYQIDSMGLKNYLQSQVQEAEH